MVVPEAFRFKRTGCLTGDRQVKLSWREGKEQA